MLAQSLGCTYVATGILYTHLVRTKSHSKHEAQKGVAEGTNINKYMMSYNEASPTIRCGTNIRIASETASSGGAH